MWEGEKGERSGVVVECQGAVHMTRVHLLYKHLTPDKKMMARSIKTALKIETSASLGGQEIFNLQAYSTYK